MDSADSADSTDSADLTDSADATGSADSADSTDSVSFTLLLKVLYLVLSYLLLILGSRVNHVLCTNNDIRIF